MDETPSASGAQPGDSTGDEINLAIAHESESNRETGPVSSAARRIDIQAEIRRPAVWGLALLIVVVLAVQIWLLFL